MTNFTDHSFLNWLSLELSERMSEKLQLIKVDPKKTLIIDDASPGGLKIVRRLYPQTEIFGTSQISGGVLNLLKNLLGKGIPNFFHVSSTPAQQIHLPDQQIDLLWANGWRFHHGEPWKQTLSEWHRILRAEGLLMFSYLGPDTAKELRGLNQPGQVLGLDMHDMGDGLAQVGFSDPVMDMEYLTLSYQEADLLIKDARALGFISKAPMDREVEAQIQQLKTADGLWYLTIEVVYGHAWWVKPRIQGLATIRPEDIKIKSK